VRCRLRQQPACHRVQLRNAPVGERPGESPRTEGARTGAQAAIAPCRSRSTSSMLSARPSFARTVRGGGLVQPRADQAGQAAPFRQACQRLQAAICDQRRVTERCKSPGGGTGRLHVRDALRYLPDGNPWTSPIFAGHKASLLFGPHSRQTPTGGSGRTSSSPRHRTGREV
jgi:hypothetical protein